MNAGGALRIKSCYTVTFMNSRLEIKLECKATKEIKSNIGNDITVDSYLVCPFKKSRKKNPG